MIRTIRWRLRCPGCEGLASAKLVPRLLDFFCSILEPASFFPTPRPHRGYTTGPSRSGTMSDAIREEAPANKLVEYKIYLRETIRAATAVLGPTCNAIIRRGDLHTLGKDLLIGDYNWPLTVVAGSTLGVKIDELISRALYRGSHTKGIGSLNKRNIKPLKKYLVQLPSFYDDKLDTSEDGIVTGGEIFVIQDDFPYTRIDHQRTFERFVSAVELKSEVFPEGGERDESWHKYRHAEIAEFIVPSDLNSIISIHHDTDSETHVGTSGTCATQNPNSDDAALEILRRSSISDHETGDAMYTPSTTTETSSIPIQHSPTREAPNIQGFKITFFAMIKTATKEKMLEINPSHIEYPESKVHDAATHLWNWMSSRGLVDKLSLDDVIGLARDMVDKKDEGVGITG
ncbi:hypothetical protein BDV95DRAFT_54552 [Massariosphaeria phaeospora]|uniref:Uncharacterized protein n=1 Tax=Massariosphaeria phaeospora TaxID=100035 RepID=A0A7C8I560_9PLEO|nr:hypothetical protein BDV95DRAFT_54552 [Massariosphaeria phaeospora]